MWELGLSLGALFLASFATRDKCVIGVALALLANWLINTAVVGVTHNPFPWGFFIASDYLTGVFILALVAICDKPAVGPIAVAFSYAVQCVMHASYGMSSQGAWANYYYYWALFHVAVAQMLFVAGWGVYELARHYLGDFSRKQFGRIVQHGAEEKEP